MQSDVTGYAFGDTDVAARRLALLAETFADSSRAFMRESAETRPQRAVDLGCGPGYSTHLVASTLSPEHTAGLDNSESFLALARTTASEKVSFHLHAITTVPFPTGPCDLIFSRFELTHLLEPEAVVGLWGTQLRAGGRLLIEEVEQIDTANPTLASYLDMQHAMLTQQGNALYIGPRLDAIADSATMRRRSSQVRVLQVSASQAAAMFHMNFGVWKHNDFVQRTYEPAALDDLENNLHAVAEGRSDAAPVEWGLRQIVMERVGQ